MVQSYDGSCGITAPTTKTGSHRDPLSQLNVEADRSLGPRQYLSGCAIDEVTLVCSQIRRIASQPNTRAVSTQADLHLVFKSNRLHDRPKIMKPIGTTVEDTQDH